MTNEIVCDSKEYGEKFRDARVEAGLSLADLAKRLNDAGIKSDSSAMSRLERDQQEPGVIWAANAAVALNTTLDGLVYKTRPPVRTRRELKDSEQKALAKIVDELTKLNDEYPDIEWFEVAAASAKGTRESVREQNAIPAGSNVKSAAPGEKTYEPPTKDERSRKGDTGKSDRLRAVSEDAPNYPEK